MDLVAGVTEKIITGFICTIFGYFLKYMHDNYKKHRIQKNIRKFFNTSNTTMFVIHSAIFDKSRCAYNFPSSDTRASRSISILFESVGMTEGNEFFITYGNQFVNDKGQIDKKLWHNNLTLLCSPKRNPITHEVLKVAPNLRYQLYSDEKMNDTIIYDTERQEKVISSRDYIKNNESTISNDGYDFGLILNMRNPHNTEKSVTILAGIHGAGTLGAAMFLSDPNNLKELIKRRQDGIIQEVVKAEYSGENENITTIKLV